MRWAALRTGTGFVEDEMTSAKILMLVGDYVEDYEAMVPLQALQMLGHTVHAVCPGKTKDQKVRTAVHDFEGDQTYSEKRGHDFTLNATFAEVDPATYDALYLPGGRAPEYLRLDEQVLRLVRHFFGANKPVCAVCHGVQVLTTAGVLKGRKCSGYYACEPEVVQAGGVYIKIGLLDACTDGNLVTAVAWPSHPAALIAFRRLLEAR
jgi:protease I